MEAEKKPVGEMTAADLHEASVGWAERSFDADGLTPTFSILTDEGIAIVMAPWRNEEEKVACFEMVSQKLAEDKARAYSLAHEIYVTATTVAEARKPASIRKGHREEVLMISTYGRDGEVFISRFLITPARQGHDPSLGPRVDYPDEEARGFGGRMFNLFRSYRQRMADNDRIDEALDGSMPLN